MQQEARTGSTFADGVRYEASDGLRRNWQLPRLGQSCHHVVQLALK